MKKLVQIFNLLFMSQLLLNATIAQTPKNGPVGICYVEVNSNNILNVGSFTLKNGGQQLFDVAIIFAANINYDTLRQRPVLFSNNNVSKILKNASTYIQPLQAKGIKVLLDVLGNHQAAGICNLNSRAAARDFAQQIAHTVNEYGLDGVDFDDEWVNYGTNGTAPANDSSFIMILQELKPLIPNKLITFYNVGQASGKLSWNGILAGNYLNYAWNGYYGNFFIPNVPGMTNAQKSPAAAWIGQTATATVTSLANQTMSGGYGVFMWYDLKSTSTASYLSSGSVPLYGDSTALTGTLQTWTAGDMCFPLYGHLVSSITTSSATLSWNTLGSNTYTIDYKPASSSVWINAATATSATTVTISGLQENTVYDWRIKSNCSGSGSVYSYGRQFTTTTTSGGGGGSTSGNYSLSFSGSGQYVNTGSVNLSGTALTLEGWVNVNAFKSASPFITTVMGIEVSQANAALVRFGDVGIPNNKLQYVLSNGTSQVKLTSKSTFTTNTWYHIAATYDGAAMKLYINGNLDTSAAMTGSFVANGTFNLGYSFDANRNMNGLLDEMRVWKKALSPSEIIAGMCSVNPASASLESYWRLNDGNTIISDTTGHGHTGTMVGMTTANWSANVTGSCASLPAPVANFSGTPTSITTGQSVTFTNSSSNATAYSWTFTGGTPSTSTAANPVVAYSTAGIYTVKLVATNASGADSIVRTDYITVTNPSAVNYSLSFNGTNQSVNAGTINLSGSSITMEGWIRANAFKTTFPYISTIMGTEATGNTALLRMGDAGITAGNKLQFVLYFGTQQVKLTSNTVFATNTWYHVAATYDGTTMNIYVNGVLDASLAQTGSFTSNGIFNIGYSYDNNRYWNGNMDELRVWKRALTQAEIQGNLCYVPVNSASLEAYWKMNEGIGTATADVTGHLHTGTMTNMTAANWSTVVPSACGTTAVTRLTRPSGISLVQVKASPNPVVKNDVISISVSKLFNNMTLSVFSADGREVMNRKLVHMNTTISTVGLTTGVYFYAVRGDGGQIVGSGKIVIK